MAGCRCGGRPCVISSMAGAPPSLQTARPRTCATRAAAQMSRLPTSTNVPPRLSTAREAASMPGEVSELSTTSTPPGHNAARSAAKSASEQGGAVEDIEGQQVGLAAGTRGCYAQQCRLCIDSAACPFAHLWTGCPAQWARRANSCAGRPVLKRSLLCPLGWRQEQQPPGRHLARGRLQTQRGGRKRCWTRQHCHISCLLASNCICQPLLPPCLTCGGMDEHSLPRLHSRGSAEASICREEDGGECASRVRCHMGWHRHHCRRAHQEQDAV